MTEITILEKVIKNVNIDLLTNEEKTFILEQMGFTEDFVDLLATQYIYDNLFIIPQINELLLRKIFTISKYLENKSICTLVINDLTDSRVKLSAAADSIFNKEPAKMPISTRFDTEVPAISLPARNTSLAPMKS